MSASKNWAYVTEFGFQRITAWAITQERGKHGGKPLGRTYWSNDKPGQRKRVKQVQRDGSTFFAYLDPADATGGGRGESLSHRLLKDAIAGLNGTKLKLRKFGEHDITITHGETEKLIQTPGGPFYADAYLRFTSTTSLGLRWSGEVYIEVHHAHAVPVDKVKALSQQRVPVVEVDLADIFLYPYEHAGTTDPLEQAHVRRIQNMLQKGYITGTVISDRRSVEYLELEVTRLAGQRQQALAALEQAKADTAGLQNRLENTVALLDEARGANAIQAQRIAESARTTTRLQGELDREREQRLLLNDALTEANGTINTQQSEVRFAFWVLVFVFVGVLAMAAFLGYQRYVVKPSSSPDIGVAAVPPRENKAAQQPSVLVKKQAARASAPRSHRVQAAAPAVSEQ